MLAYKRALPLLCFDVILLVLAFLTLRFPVDEYLEADSLIWGRLFLLACIMALWFLIRSMGGPDLDDVIHDCANRERWDKTGEVAWRLLAGTLSLEILLRCANVLYGGVFIGPMIKLPVAGETLLTILAPAIFALIVTHLFISRTILRECGIVR